MGVKRSQHIWPLGQPKYRFTDTQRNMVENLVAAGLTHVQIAPLVKDQRTGKSISVPSLERHFKTELRDGLPKANATIAGALFSTARDGNVTAQIFWLKTRARWKETNVLEVGGIAGQPIEVTNNALNNLVGLLDQMAARIDSGTPGNGIDRPAEAPGAVTDHIH
jgi:hypothetical protein